MEPKIEIVEMKNCLPIIFHLLTLTHCRKKHYNISIIIYFYIFVFTVLSLNTKLRLIYFLER